MQGKAIEKSAYFSIDDTGVVFLTLLKERPESIFEVPILRRYYDLHQRYGVKFSCYCFAYYDRRSWVDSPPRGYVGQFEENADWLRFGFHSYSLNDRYDLCVPEVIAYDYSVMTDALRQTVGTAITHTIRLHEWRANEEGLHFLYLQGLYGLLCSETGKTSYDLNEKELRRMVKNRGILKNNVKYLPTDIRIETMSNYNEVFSAFLKDSQQEYCEVFTHEWALLQNEENWNRMQELIEAACLAGCRFDIHE